MEEDSVPISAPKIPEKKRYFGLTTTQLLGIVGIIIGFIMIIIGICILAKCILGSVSAEKPPSITFTPKPKQKKKSKTKEEVPDKKEDIISQEAASLLVEEYQTTSIKPNIIVPSDTETEQEVLDPED